MVENNENITKPKPSAFALSQSDAAIELDDINVDVGLNENTKS